MNHTKNTHKGFTEGDWKLLRKKIGTWQENYINRLNKEYIAILTQDKNPSEKFWQLEKRIYKDKRKPGVSIDLKRSTMISNILTLLNDGTIEMNDLDDFSDILKDTIQTYRSILR